MRALKNCFQAVRVNLDSKDKPRGLWREREMTDFELKEAV